MASLVADCKDYRRGSLGVVDDLEIPYLLYLRDMDAALEAQDALIARQAIEK